MVTQALVKERYYYSSGNLYHKLNNGGAIKDRKVGAVSSCRYLKTSIMGRFYLIHRLIYLYHHGFLPKYLDHIDGDPLNNKIENLRACSYTQNGYNSKLAVNNTSGHKGVTWSKKSEKWQAYLNVNGKYKYLGLFSDIESAAEARKAAAEKHHKEFARAE